MTAWTTSSDIGNTLSYDSRTLERWIAVNSATCNKSKLFSLFSQSFCYFILSSQIYAFFATFQLFLLFYPLEGMANNVPISKGHVPGAHNPEDPPPIQFTESQPDCVDSSSESEGWVEPDDPYPPPRQPREGSPDPDFVPVQEVSHKIINSSFF